MFTRLALDKNPADLMLTRSDGLAWGTGHQRRRLEAACRKAKIEPTGFHDLRRTYGARLAMQGVPMAVIAEALGHADERITRRHYAHLAPSYVGDMIRRHVGTLSLGVGQ